MTEHDRAAIIAEQERIRARYLRTPAEHPGSSARGIRDITLVCGHVERTVAFWPSSTCQDSTSDRIPRSSAGCIAWPSQSSRRSGDISGQASARQA